MRPQYFFIIFFIVEFLPVELFGQNSDLGVHKYLSDQSLITDGFIDGDFDIDPRDTIDVINTADHLLSKYYADSLINELELPPVDFDFPSPSTLFSGSLKQAQGSLDQVSLFNNQSLSKSLEFSSSVQVESFYSNLDLPFNRIGTNYLRISADPEVQIFSIPFRAQFYYTTEDNSFYQSNFFTLKYDPSQMRDNLDNKKEELRSDLKDQYRNLYNQKEQIDRYKGDVSRYQSQLDGKLKELENQIYNEIESIKREQQRKIDSTALNTKQRAQDSIQNKKGDHLDLDTNDIRKDSSLAKKYNRLQALMKTYNQIKTKYDLLSDYSNKADTLKNEIENVESKIVEHQSKLSPDIQEFKKQGNDSIMNKLNSNPFFSAIKELDIGLSNPYYSRNSLNGIAVKGLNVLQEFEHSNMFYQFTTGKAQKDFSSFYFGNNEGPRFTRNLVASKIGKGQVYGNNYYFTHVQIWDPQNTDEQATTAVNSVSGFGVNQSFRLIRISSEILMSTYKRDVNGFSSKELVDFNPLKNLSVFSEVEVKLNSYIKLKSKLDYKSADFRSLGSPFLRNDYLTQDYKLDLRNKPNKLMASLFYKELRHNLSQINAEPNIMKGFGLMGRTNYQKWPNIQVNYSPFEQSNYHSDSLQRTNNKFESLSALMFYQKTFGRHYFYWTAAFNRANVEYQELQNQKSSTSILSVNQLYEGQRLRSSISYTYSYTEPFIDTVSFHSINSTLTYKRLKYGITLNTNFKQTLSGGTYLLNSTCYQRKLFKAMLVSGEIGFGKVDGIWGIEKQSFYQVNLNLRYQFGKT